MPKKNKLQFYLDWWDCTGLTGPDAVLPLAVRLPAHDLLPADNDDVAVADVPALVATKTHQAPEELLRGTWDVHFRLVPRWTDPFIGGFDCYDTAEGISVCGVGGLLGRDEQAHVEPFAQRLRAWGQAVYPLARPALGRIDSTAARILYPKEVRRTKLVSIGWVNWFGPRYVERYSQDLLLGIPGHTTTLLDDGGVFHQLTPTFLVDDAKAAAALKRAVRAHFQHAGLKVTCQAPYVQRRIFDPPLPPPLSAAAARAEYGSLDEFRAGVAGLLGTTLVLKDGRRVKVLYLQWSRLPDLYSEVALKLVRAAAEAEVAAHPAARVHFEFSELTDEVALLMNALRRTYPQLTFFQVDMDPTP